MKNFKHPGIIGNVIFILIIQGCSWQKPTNSESQYPAAALTATPHPGSIIVSKPIEADDSWQYLISLFAIPEVNNARIDREIAWFKKHPEYITKIQTRAEPYLYSIITVVEAKGLPGEFALLPAVESGFRAHAYSHARAAGLWQFIPSTGRLYGLEQNWWYDGRRDVYASTEAATSYLKKLGGLYDNDWLLALAAYNAGMGTVNRAIKRNKRNHKPTNYWALNLPKETQAYVPRLLALAHIFKHAKKYGISLKTQLHKPAFLAVNINSQLDLNTAAKLSETSLKELFHLNPGFNRVYTPPQGPHRILIPIDNVELFKENLAKLPQHERIQWQRHKVKTGENLGSIARRYKTKTSVIRQVNHLKNNNIRAGAYLLIPASRHKVANNPFLQANSTTPSNKYSTYTVKKGDSLWSIAKNKKVRSKDIARWNRISLKTPLQLGQKLVIKKKTTGKPKFKRRAGSTQSIHYTVRSGDSLYSISEKFNVSIRDLRKWNANKLGKYLQLGQKLKVKVDVTSPTT
jgi:membrane-bound lytic murein transglycosylase D